MPDDDSPARPAESIGPYRLLRAVGGGTTGAVFQACDIRSGRVLALKLMQPRQDDEHAVARFEAEASVLRALAHPDIVEVVDAGHWQGRPWLAMQWLPGHDLSRYTTPARLLPEALALAIGRRLAAALGHAHAHGVVHRDLKPGNVRVHLPAGIVKLADFGVARYGDATATPTGVLLGTPAYLAPEVMRGATPDGRADLYALGVVLFELLSGRRPHEATTMGELLRQVAAGPAPELRELRPDLPQALSTLVARLLHREPKARPASGDEVVVALAGVIAVLAPPPSEPTATSRAGRA